VFNDKLFVVRINWFTLGSSPYGRDAPRPYRWSLFAPYSDTSSGEPYPFTKVSEGPQT